MLAIVSKFLSWSVDAGFVLALPLHHGDLELDCVRVLTKDHVAILHGHGWGSLFARQKYLCEINIPVQEL